MESFFFFFSVLCGVENNVSSDYTSFRSGSIIVI